jgi:TPR repeat protein
MADDPGFAIWQEGSNFEDRGLLDKAIEKYKIAVRMGSVEAMINLANIFDDKMEPPDAGAAVNLYKRATELGSEVAAWNLAKHYENLGQDKLTRDWMIIAAELGDEDARIWLKANIKDY